MADVDAAFVSVPSLMFVDVGGPGALAFVPELSPLDEVTPTLANFSPAEGTSLAKYDRIEFDVTDVGEFYVTVIIGVYIVATDTTELALMGSTWENRYFSAAAGEITSSRTAISGGYHYVLRRRGGWPTGGIRVKVMAVDRGGNVGVL